VNTNVEERNWWESQEGSRWTTLELKIGVKKAVFRKITMKKRAKNGNKETKKMGVYKQ